MNLELLLHANNTHILIIHVWFVYMQHVFNNEMDKQKIKEKKKGGERERERERV